MAVSSSARSKLLLRGVDPAWLGDGSVVDDLVRRPDEDLFR